MEFDLSYVIAKLPLLWRGLIVTVEVSAVSLLLSILVGLFGAAARLFNIRILAPLVAAYVEFIRNTPILAQLFFIFYGLPSLGLTLSLFWSGVLCLVLWAGAYQVENIRGGLAAVSDGFREAAYALGLSRWLYFWLVAVPIAVRVSLPSILNTSISLIKNSSYLQAIGLAELTFVAIDRISTDFRTIEMLTSICVAYLALVLSLSFIASRVQRHLNRAFAT